MDQSFENQLKTILQQWSKALLRCQIKTDQNKGGLICPACSRIHGRSIDALHAFLWSYGNKRNKKYLTAAKMLFDWTEKHVSNYDGSYDNDVNISKWKGITVFNLITLVLTIKNFKSFLPEKILKKWRKRTQKAADYIYNNFSIKTGNINYPIAAAYALLLCGKEFKNSDYLSKADQLANESLSFFSQNNLLFGEGRPQRKKTQKGCLPIDIAYNLHESLPYLILYAIESRNELIFKKAYIGLIEHKNFILPDGAVDDSWCTRNFKWSYWGSRTADSAIPVLCILSYLRAPFDDVIKNMLDILKESTYNGLLSGGPDYKKINEPICIHHTLCQSKSLVTYWAIKQSWKDSSFLRRWIENIKINDIPEGVLYYKEAETYILKNKYWRASLTAYDWEYIKGGHPSGGALSLLWHYKWGLVNAAGSNTELLIESYNSQTYGRTPFFCISPRLEFSEGKNKFLSIDDTRGSVKLIYNDRNKTVFRTSGDIINIKNKIFKNPVNWKIDYVFKMDRLSIIIYIKNSDKKSNLLADFIFPVRFNESDVVLEAKNQILIERRELKFMINYNAGKQIHFGPVFNYSPGILVHIFKFCIGNNRKIKIDLRFS